MNVYDGLWMFMVEYIKLWMEVTDQQTWGGALHGTSDSSDLKGYLAKPSNGQSSKPTLTKNNLGTSMPGVFLFAKRIQKGMDVGQHWVITNK